MEPSGWRQPGQNELAQTLRFASSGLLIREPEKKKVRPYDRSSSGPETEHFQSICPGCRWGKDVLLRCSVPSTCPDISAAEPEQHCDVCCRLTKPGRHPLQPPPPPFPRIEFRLPSQTAEADIQDCFWWGLLPIKTPTVGCLPSFHFSKGAKASFRK